MTRGGEVRLHTLVGWCVFLQTQINCLLKNIPRYCVYCCIFENCHNYVYFVQMQKTIHFVILTLASEQLFWESSSPPDLGANSSHGATSVWSRNWLQSLNHREWRSPDLRVKSDSSDFWPISIQIFLGCNLYAPPCNAYFPSNPSPQNCGSVEKCEFIELPLQRQPWKWIWILKFWKVDQSNNPQSTYLKSHHLAVSEPSEKIKRMLERL